MQLDHVNIHVDDLAAARTFLTRLLGVTVGWRPSFKVPGDWLYLDGRAVIHTWQRDRERGLGWVDHIAFGPCGDPDAKRTELQRLGYAFTEARLLDTEIVQFFVSGPEGMKIELQCAGSAARSTSPHAL
jgi:catechol 2,3-dioxygenase-like lactoylglutathione lyase family enzyme